MIVVSVIRRCNKQNTVNILDDSSYQGHAFPSKILFSIYYSCVLFSVTEENVYFRRIIIPSLYTDNLGFLCGSHISK